MRLGLCALVAGPFALPEAALAAYPDLPIRLVVPCPPGGATDVMCRMMAMRLITVLGQTVIVDYRACASGNMGADAVAKAALDG